MRPWLTVVALFIWTAAADYIELEECHGLKFHCLDISTLARYGEFEECDLDKVRVNPANGVVYAIDVEGDRPEAANKPHYMGTHSAPWYFYQALRSSIYHVDDPDEADIVVVDDYCYYIWWLGHVHTTNNHDDHEAASPGDHLLAAYQILHNSARFERHGGADFVFYDAHPGYRNGKALVGVRDYLMTNFKLGTHIAVERTQRNIYPTYWDFHDKLMITPYVPNAASTGSGNTFGELSARLPGLEDRKLFAYLKARCSTRQRKQDTRIVNSGKRMRHEVIMAINSTGSDMAVQCSEQDLNAVSTYDAFAQVLATMENTLFCLVLPGDAQSTRRLSEVFMGGSIPVFIGPPYHSMPFAEFIDYNEVGVYFNVTEYSSWLWPDIFQWKLHRDQRPTFLQDAQWWLPDADVYDTMVQVPNVTHVVPHLRSIPRDVLVRKLAAVQAARSRFFFRSELTHPPNAANTMASGICQRHKKDTLKWAVEGQAGGAESEIMEDQDDQAEDAAEDTPDGSPDDPPPKPQKTFRISGAMSKQVVSGQASKAAASQQASGMADEATATQQDTPVQPSKAAASQQASDQADEATAAQQDLPDQPAQEAASSTDGESRKGKELRLTIDPGSAATAAALAQLQADAGRPLGGAAAHAQAAAFGVQPQQVPRIVSAEQARQGSQQAQQVAAAIVEPQESELQQIAGLSEASDAVGSGAGSASDSGKGQGGQSLSSKDKAANSGAADAAGAGAGAETIAALTAQGGVETGSTGAGSQQDIPVSQAGKEEGVSGSAEDELEQAFPGSSTDQQSLQGSVARSLSDQEGPGDVPEVVVDQQSVKGEAEGLDLSQQDDDPSWTR